MNDKGSPESAVCAKFDVCLWFAMLQVQEVPEVPEHLQHHSISYCYRSKCQGCLHRSWAAQCRLRQG